MEKKTIKRNDITVMFQPAPLDQAAIPDKH